MATDTKIVLKRSDVSTAVPNLEYLQFGELAFNYRDEKLYYRSYDVNGTTEIIKNYDFQRVVPVAKGGTGATTATDARTNLEAAAIFSPAFLGTPSLAAAAVQPTISISTVDAAAQRALATVAYVRAEIADDAPTKTGGGASGLWGISVTGNAGTASKWAAAKSITSNNTSAGSDITFNVSLDGSANVTPTLAINTNRVSNIQTALSLVPGTNIQAYDADLAAIAALTGTSGFLKKTAANTWSLDTETYTPTSRTVTIATGNGITGGGVAQSLGANLSWTLGLTDTGVVANTYNDNATSVTPFTVDAKGRITGTGTPVLVTPAFSSITGKPTDLAGYGILDALNTSATGQTKAGSLTASSFIKTSGTSSQFLKADGSSDGTSYTPTARTLTFSTGNGITGGVTAADLSANRSWTFGLTGQALNLHNLATDGFFVRSTSGGTTSIVARSIAVGSGLSIANADGVSANPNISLATSNLSSLRDIATGGFLTRTAASTLTPRSIIVSGTGLSITNADGVSGDPTISSNATSSNSVSTIVSRDASGNFSAGAITGSSFVVSGTVNTTLVGSATGTAKTLTLPNTTDTVAVLADIPSHAGGADTTIPVADGRVLSAIVVNSLGHTTSVSSKTLAAADIPSLDTSKITTGTFEAARISDETVTGKVLTGLGTLFFGAEITSTDTILQAFRKLQGSVSAKANSTSPTFTGTVTLPIGTPATAPLRFVSGTNLTTAVAGAVEFNGTNLFITNSALSRKTLAYTDSTVSSATSATTATRLATARTISQGAASDINFSYTFDGNANVTPNLTINTSRASNIRSALGLEIGTNVQAYDADLAAIAALSDNQSPVGIDTGFLRKTGENTWIIDQETTPPNADENTTISGDVIGASANGSRDILDAVLATVNTSPGTYNNSATAITPFTVDGKGRITSTGTSVTILPDWSSIANKPTTLSGYAITDAQALNSNLTSISAFTGTNNGLLRRNNDSSWTLDTTTYVPASRTLTITGAAGSGITVTPNSATDLSANRAWSLSLEAGNLTQLRDLGTNTGIIAHNGTTGGGMVTRTIVPLDPNEITISNGNGVSGNPTISLTTSNLTSLRGITTGGFLTRTASNTLTPRSITIAAGSTGLSITNADGVSGNPTLTLSSTSLNSNNSLVARDSVGNFAAGTISGTNFRAALGVPTPPNAFTNVGFQFGSDANSGLFSSANSIISLYSNFIETLRSTSTGVALYGTPTAPTAPTGTNTTQIATTAYVRGEITSLIGAAPAALDTLAELAAALGDNANYASTITTALAGKEPTITAGTTAQYWRGDKSWQTLNATAVGLGNVTNESKGTMFTSPTFTGTATAPTVSAGNYLVTGNSTIASGVAVQRVLTKSNIPIGNIARLAEFTAGEGNVAIEIQVSSNTNGNSGTSTYRFQGGYLSLQIDNPTTPTAAFYRLYPFNDGRGHGEGTDTGLATTPWMIMIYQVQHVGSTGGYGVAIVNTSATVVRSVTVTITELRRGMTFTDRSADAAVSFGTSAGNLYSHTNLLVGNRIGVGKVPTTALDVNGTITATTYSGGATLSGAPTAPTATVSTNTDQIATTAFVLGQAANTTPLMDGVNALSGSSTRYARADHVHQTDTTRAPLASPAFTGTIKIGSSTSRTYYLPAFDTNYTPGIQGVGNSYASPAWMSLAQWSTSTTSSGGAFISLNKSNGVEGTQTIVSNNQRVGGIGFAGSDGAKFLGVADVYGEVDAPPALNSMPGRLVFATTADGFTTPSERMRITRQGRVGIWKTNPSSALDVDGTITALTFSGSGASLTSIPNSATTATNANTASAIVARDASGNFSAGTITATAFSGSLTGTASGNIKQGGGTSQTGNVIYMGWSAASKLRVQVDTTDFGSTWPIDVSGNAATATTCTGNAGSVTNGVYTSGDQNILGQKTFTNLETRFETNANLANGPTIALRKTRGTQAAPTAVAAGDYLGTIGFAGHDGNSVSTRASISSIVTNSIVGAVSNKLVFSNTGGSNWAGYGSPAFEETRMTIESTGEVKINNTLTIDNTFGIQKMYIGGIGANSAHGIVMRKSVANTVAATAISFYNSGNTQIGVINLNASNGVSFTSTSDYRLKEDYKPIDQPIERLRLLKPTNFKWIDDDTCRVDGFIAHELQEVVPEAVVGNKDEVDEQGNMVLQGVDASKIIPLLTAALQEQQKTIDALTARLDSLENKNS